MNTKLTFKSDRFKKNRSGYSRLLLLSCEKCKNLILLYQKDGLGILKRLYLDRIIIPLSLADGNKNLICKKCNALLGIPMIYQKEKRLAYRLFSGAVEKKIIKADELSEINF